MSQGSESTSVGNGWADATLALVVGIAVLGGMVFLVAVLRPAGLSPPPAEAIPLFVYNTTAAAVSFVLLGRDSRLGYLVAIGTGLLVVTTIVLLALGLVGELPRGGNPIGPLAYATLGAAVVVTSGIAWRRRGANEAAATTASPS